jgi:hypothetical protein
VAGAGQTWAVGAAGEAAQEYAAVGLAVGNSGRQWQLEAKGCSGGRLGGSGDSSCMCVCVRERECEREGGAGGGSTGLAKKFIISSGKRKINRQK